jgi:carbon storage regulator
MLHLTRRVGQSIVIGEAGNLVVVTINGFSGNQIKLSVSADKNIPVYREEVYQRMQTEKKKGHL